jgi:NAD(P)-dependent dehydrogenase (short-subunit alcohol dehydrogenase family)
MPVALITGASRGLGAALAEALAGKGWQLVVDARGADDLEATAARIRAATGADVVAVPGDVADPAHRAALVAEAGRLGRLDLLVNNASVLGPSPQPELARYPLGELERVYAINVVAVQRTAYLAR